jgi:hypothetical protein
VNLWIVRLDLDGELGGCKDVYWFGHPVCGGLRYQLCIRFAVGVIDDQERDGCLKSLVCVERVLKTALLA